jgi:hypothetical protein
MSIKLRLTMNAVNYDFDQEETYPCIETPLIQTDLQQNQVGAPNLILYGSVYNAYSVQIKHFYSTTRAKIETLIEGDATITAYFDYGENTTSNPKSVILSQDMIKESYHFGEYAAKVITTLIFLQYA